MVALVVNVAGNLVFVPLVGFMGAAWMTLGTEIVVFGASLEADPRAGWSRAAGLGRIGRTLAAALLMGGALEALRVEHASLRGVLAAACVLPGALLGLRAPGASTDRADCRCAGRARLTRLSCPGRLHERARG